MSYYKNHREYLEAVKREWQIQVERTDDEMNKENRKNCQKILDRVLQQIEDEDLAFLRID